MLVQASVPVSRSPCGQRFRQYFGIADDPMPPYAETQIYVEKVRALYTRYRAAMGRPLHVAEIVGGQ